VTPTRHDARAAALQALYWWEVGRTDPEAALEAYFAVHGADLPNELRAFTRELVLGTVAEIEALDRLIAAHAQRWRVDRLAIVDRLILRIGAWELRHGGGTPPAVAIDEALELARTFSGEESVKFVNGVLDAIRRDLERAPS
jgi:N utilization substance protein B